MGLTFRNIDDCFWPSAQPFIPRLAEMVRQVKELSGAPVVLGGCGYSILARPILELTGADFGIRGDGEAALVALYRELEGRRKFERVPGLLWRDGGEVRANAPAWPEPLSVPTGRREIDNAAYFRLGGQGAVETKRGCDRRCIYCADPLAKGPRVRRRSPAEVADEVESLLGQGVDVLHLADSRVQRAGRARRRRVRGTHPPPPGRAGPVVRVPGGRAVRRPAGRCHEAGRVRGDQLHGRLGQRRDARGLPPAAPARGPGRWLCGFAASAASRS